MSLKDRIKNAKPVTPEVVDLGISATDLAESGSTPLAIAVTPLKELAGQVFEYATSATGGGYVRHSYEVMAAKFIALETTSTKKGEKGKPATVVYVGFLGKPIKLDEDGNPEKNKDGSFKHADHEEPEEMCVEFNGELIPNLCEFRLAWGVNYQKSANKRLSEPEIKIAMSRNVPTNAKTAKDGRTFWNEDWDVIPFGRNLLHWAHNSLLVGIEEGNQSLQTIYDSIPTESTRKKDDDDDTEADDIIDKVNAAAAEPVGVTVEN